MLQALRSALRSLSSRPGSSALLVVIVALAVAAAAAAFSAAETVLVRALPFRDADRLVLLNAYHRSSALENDISWLEIGDWRRQSRLYEEIVPLAYYEDRLLFQGEAVERIGVNFVGAAYFRVLGVAPQLGRFFAPRGAEPAGSAPEMVLSDALWQRLYRRDPNILGKTVQLNSRQFTVVGVAPAGFRDFVEGTFLIDAWLPAAMAVDTFTEDLFESRSARYWIGLARLRPGATVEQARAEAAPIYAGLARAFPDTNQDYEARVTPLRQLVFRDLYPRMPLVLAGALVVLLLVCINVAIFLRVRVAGAPKAPAPRQVLSDGLLLAALGGALGLLLAPWTTRAFAGLTALPPFSTIRLDAPVLALTAAAALLVGLLFSLPAARLARATGGTPRSTGGWGRDLLLVVQTVVVVALLVVAGLLLRSYLALRGTGLGFVPDRLLTLALSFETDRFLENRPLIPQAEQELLQRLRATPGVEGAAVWGPGMPGIGHPFTDVGREGAPAGEPAVRVDMHSINPGALALLGVPVLRGRDIGPQDVREVPRVAVVSQSLAAALWPGQDPLGKRLHRTDREGDPWATVVGVMGDPRLQGRLSDGSHHLVFSHVQLPTREANLLVRTGPGVDPAAMADTVRRLVRAVDPQIPVYEVATLDERLREQEGAQRLNAAVAVSCALLALMLTGLGFYGLLASGRAEQREPVLLNRTSRRGLGLAAVGLVLGLAAAFAGTRLLTGLLFGITARDPFTFAGVAVLFAAVALLATALSSRRTPEGAGSA
jgi:putative ABC transport system permease protein